MIGTIVIVVLLIAAGFVAGALVYRNNVKKAEAVIVDLEQKIEELKGKIEGIK